MFSVHLGNCHTCSPSLLNFVLDHIQGPFQTFYRLTTGCQIGPGDSNDHFDYFQSSEIRSVDGFHLVGVIDYLLSMAPRRGLWGASVPLLELSTIRVLLVGSVLY